MGSPHLDELVVNLAVLRVLEVQLVAAQPLAAVAALVTARELPL